MSNFPILKRGGAVNRTKPGQRGLGATLVLTLGTRAGHRVVINAPAANSLRP